jgi:hypothetical protein
MSFFSLLPGNGQTTKLYQLSSISYRHVRSDAFSLWAGYTAEMTVQI